MGRKLHTRHRPAIASSAVTAVTAAVTAAAILSGCHAGLKSTTRPGPTSPISPNRPASPLTVTTITTPATAPSATGAPGSPTTSTTPVTAATATTAVAAGFTSTMATITAADVPLSWHSGCPLAPDRLRMLRLSYWGFDDQPHAGTIIVNAAVTSDVVKIFGQLFAEHFPIYQMQPVDVFQGSDPDSMAANNTSGFNCRLAVGAATPQWSVHAYGEAIDVNTVENPYLEGGSVMPAAGRAYLDRTVYRPGMAVAGGQLVKAFASAGWQWGGRWPAPDYQHFSKTGG